MTELRFIGVDAHRDFAHVSEIREGKVIASYRVLLDADGLCELKKKLGPDAHVVFEASTGSFRLYDELAPHAGRVVVAHPAQTRGAAALQAKTDRLDSEILARLLSVGFVREVWVPDPEVRAMRMLIEYRQTLTTLLTATQNRLKGLMRQEMLHPPPGSATRSEWRKFVEGCTFTSPICSLYSESLFRVMDLTVTEIDKLDAEFSRWSAGSEDARLLMTIPGVGPVIAAFLLSQIGDVHRFPAPRQLCAYAGIVPRVYQSGLTSRTGAITRAGRAPLRWALTSAVMHAKRRPGALHDFAEGLSKRRPKGVVLVACARKLLTIIWHMLSHHCPYRDQDEALTARKLANLSARGVTKADRADNPETSGIAPQSMEGCPARSKRRGTVRTSASMN